MWQRFKVQAFQNIRKYFLLYSIILFFFIMGVATGTFTIKSIPEPQKKEVAQYMNSFLSSIVNQQVNTWLIFKESLLSNLQIVIIMTLMGMFIYTMPLIFILIGIRGFYIGFTVGFLISELGFKGVLLVILGILPQNIIILPCLLLCGAVTVNHAMNTFKSKRIKQSRYEKIKYLTPFIFTMCRIFLFILLGIAIETAFVPFILKAIISII